MRARNVSKAGRSSLREEQQLARCLRARHRVSEPQRRVRVPCREVERWSAENMWEAGNRRCGAMLACMDKLQGRIAGMPRDAANFWVGALGAELIRC